MALQKTISRYGHDFVDAYSRIGKLNYSIKKSKKYNHTQPNKVAYTNENGATGYDYGESIVSVLEVVEKICVFNVYSYLSKSDCENGEEAFAVKQYSFLPDMTITQGLLGQAYSYLKTLEEFDGSIDV
jgi:hypothetical protein